MGSGYSSEAIFTDKEEKSLDDWISAQAFEAQLLGLSLWFAVLKSHDSAGAHSKFPLQAHTIQ